MTTQIKAKTMYLCINYHLYYNLCRFSLIHLRYWHKNGIIGEIGKNGGNREKSVNFVFFSKNQIFTLTYIFWPISGKMHANLAIL